MCGISGHLATNANPGRTRRIVEVMNERIIHRGPDGKGVFVNASGSVGLGHVRLSIIDIASGSQPMTSRTGLTVVFNGEIYNYIELKRELADYPFETKSDTEVLLAAYVKWGRDLLSKLRGMFAFAIWDPEKEELFCARDHFGIKPFYYVRTGDGFFFGSEVKALLPFLPSIEPDLAALKNYFFFQIQLGVQTLFKDVLRLEPGTSLVCNKDGLRVERYWVPSYKPQNFAGASTVAERLHEALKESVHIHVRSDVPIGAYVSGGIDSSFVAAMANREKPRELIAFNGKFTGFSGQFDESNYAHDVSRELGIPIIERTITAKDFRDSFHKIVYHMDYPEAGPGSFAQYCISQTAAEHRKVLLGGQGGDELFAGYVRYLVGYLEQCLKEEIDGEVSPRPGHLRLENLVGSLRTLKSYKPMMQELFKKELFGALPRRYYSLVVRAPDLESVVDFNSLGPSDPFEHYMSMYNRSGADRDDYLHGMLGFDLITLLPALLHVEDRVSMAWGLESRVPIVDKEVFEFAASLPENLKMQGGKLKGLLIDAIQSELPRSVRERKDKMGFPVPLNHWLKGELRDFAFDVFSQSRSNTRGFYDTKRVLEKLDTESDYARNLWGLLSIEVWHQVFVDQASEFRFKD